jgi:transcriptional regulator with XRE-family HTH domain
MRAIWGSQEEKKMMSDANRVEFGKRLAKLVADKHWTDAQFAREASKHYRGAHDFRRCDISLYMRGIQFPKPARLKAICETLGVAESALGTEVHVGMKH